MVTPPWIVNRKREKMNYHILRLSPLPLRMTKAVSPLNAGDNQKWEGWAASKRVGQHSSEMQFKRTFKIVY